MRFVIDFDSEGASWLPVPGWLSARSRDVANLGGYNQLSISQACPPGSRTFAPVGLPQLRATRAFFVASLISDSAETVATLGIADCARYELSGSDQPTFRSLEMLRIALRHNAGSCRIASITTRPTHLMEAPSNLKPQEIR